MTAPENFVHLHLHTEHSLVDGLLRVKPLVQQVRESGMPAVAVTEQSNLFSLVKFYRTAEAAGLKPIIGVDAWIHDPTEPEQPTRLILIAQDVEGYRNLTRLVSRSYVEGQRRGVPMISPEWLHGATDGLIALSGAQAGDIGQALLAGHDGEAERRLADWRARFPDRFYLELQRTGREDEEVYIDAALDLAAAAAVPVVATNDVRFARPEDFEAHEARVCIHDGRVLADPRRPRRYTEQQYLRSPADMATLFADIPEALTNSVEIARRCNLTLTLGKNVLPAFPVPAGRSVEEWFEAESRSGLESRLAARFDIAAAAFAEQRRPYDERLATELAVISRMGYPGYFLIVADFIRWARENGVPVGPGRGSGAGSLVAYALGITDLDPLDYDLLFERFLNPERVSLPDFDVDFCMEGRDRVIEYVTGRYGGTEYVSQIITFGTMAAKAVVRDVGRVLGHPYGFVDQIAKLVPFELGITLDRALAEEEALRRRYEEEEDVRTLIDLARKLEGLTRNAGRHAGGVVIAPTPLTDFTPLYCEQGSAGVVTQLDKDDVESVGLVKFDFLGLRTLTIIDRALEIINSQRADKGEAPIHAETLPTDDDATYGLIKRGATTAVFQLESRGMKDLIRRLQPDCFEDVIALVALFRPGPLQSGMVDDFIDRKHGKAHVAYPHPDLEPVLRPTYGVILYQEQVMQIAQVLARYTLGGADLLRRAMGKKKAEEMAKQRATFLEGCRTRQVDERQANHIFDLMEKFAGYGFNKSHSAAYALIAYQTAWLKAHYPAAFMAAVLSADMDHTDKVVGFVGECRDMGIQVARPDINDSEYAFTVEDERTIRYGLGAIKGAGRAALEGIRAERERGAPFVDLFDFCRRVDSRRVNRRMIEALIRAGAMDALGPSRAAMLASLTRALQTADQEARDRSTGQSDLFGGAAAERSPNGQFAVVDEWSEQERLAGEKETLGLYLTGHPIARFAGELGNFVKTRLADLRPAVGQSQVAAGLVADLRTRNSRNGRMAFITLDDGTARLEAVAYTEVYERHRDAVVKDRLVVASGEIDYDEFIDGPKMVVREIYSMDEAREAYARALVIRVDAESMANGFMERLAGTLAPFREGRIPVCVDYRRADAAAPLTLGEAWRIKPAEELLQRLRGIVGEGGVALRY